MGNPRPPEPQRGGEAPATRERPAGSDKNLRRSLTVELVHLLHKAGLEIMRDELVARRVQHG